MSAKLKRLKTWKNPKNGIVYWRRSLTVDGKERVWYEPNDTPEALASSRFEAWRRKQLKPVPEKVDLPAREEVEQPQTEPVLEMPRNIAGLVRAWIASLEERNGNPIGVDRKLAMSDSSLKARRMYGQQFADQYGRFRLNQGDVSVVMTNYRQKLVSRIAKGDLTKNSANSMIQYVATMMQWGWDKSLIKDLPRDWKTLKASFRINEEERKENAVDITWEELRELFRHASPDFRAHILFACNFGLGPTDIALARFVNLDRAKMEYQGKRVKTNIGFWFPVWQETLDHMDAATRCNDEQYIFGRGGKHVKRRGELLTKTPNMPSRSNCIRSSFDMAWKRSGKIRKVVSFYSIRRACATFMFAHSPGLEKLYLAHSIKGVERHYINIERPDVREKFSIAMEKLRVKVMSSMGVAFTRDYMEDA